MNLERQGTWTAKLAELEAAVRTHYEERFALVGQIEEALERTLDLGDADESEIEDLVDNEASRRIIELDQKVEACSSHDEQRALRTEYCSTEIGLLLWAHCDAVHRTTNAETDRDNAFYEAGEAFGLTPEEVFQVLDRWGGQKLLMEMINIWETIPNLRPRVGALAA